ncbi:hypothetical protein E4U42_005808 [Claviceps africana]|uniref:DNA mismatch repair protein PMS1 n=1 Tax=Claviceps africana TaxID=83212 RepID=A0A8K0J3E0_9HYPO|nr:hypothetical protein E4U42_005808 [Claviceps africana]
MAASIKPIDDKSIHLIQSGQVIVDLCSVVKELVENSVDSGAHIIDVRFKNQGLDRIEVQDNGSGISPANHQSIALKHHTSKLSSYSDIGSLQTFGFRGEALASLCALSQLSITTCIESEAPKGYKLSFDASGKLCDTALTAAQRGTTVSVEALFNKLPVRRRELERNIKREWHKVITLLNQYACIQTNLKFSVWQQPTKGKRVLLFSTKGNRTTRENIINIFGSKVMSSLVPMDISLEMESSRIKPVTEGLPPARHPSRQVHIKGHVSRPVRGDGRQTPDRQMFFVNGRPCGLPQFAKTFNEVYKSYNYSQSPFIFADIQLDTNMYDVNVSPDKRTILLHDQSSLLDSIRTSLGALFDSHDHRLPAAPFPSLQSSESSVPLLPALPPLITGVTPSNDQRPASITDDIEKNGRLLKGSCDTELQSCPKLTTKKGSRRVDDGQPSVSKWLKRDGQPKNMLVFDTSDMNETGLGLQEKRSWADDAVGHFAHTSDASSSDSDVETLTSRGNVAQEQNNELRSTEELLRHSPNAEGDMEKSRDGSSPCCKQPGRSTTPITKMSGILLHAEGSLDSGATLKHVTPALVNNVGKPMDEDCSSENGSNNESAASIVHHQSSADEVETNRQHTHSPEFDFEAQNPQQFDNGAAATLSRIGDLEDRNGKKTFDQTATIKTIMTNEGRKRKFANVQTLQVIYATEKDMARFFASWGQGYTRNLSGDSMPDVGKIDTTDAESKLSLMISKSDFAKMRVVGQFNLGFIIAVRPRPTNIAVQSAMDAHDELLIIDQHASDEKFNFENLQANTVVQSQRLVHPKTLHLTALDEEIVLQNLGALEANGFQVQINAADTASMGSRCQLVALPLSRESTFDVKDLEDLISLLADQPAGSKHIPRPSAVRKMFAMRACRSSIMIGKALTTTQMYTIVRHMGELDKPWNCPHGRPTMRHLCRIQALQEAQWTADKVGTKSVNSWNDYIRKTCPDS